MLTPPTEIMIVLSCFAQVFSERTWDWVQVLVVGAILAPGKRTVTSVLTAVGLSQEKQYQRYHRVLNRAKWSSLQASKIVLGLLVDLFLVDTGGRKVLLEHVRREISALFHFRQSDTPLALAFVTASRL